MELKEYVESSGWKLEDLTPKELRAVKRELRAINQAYDVLDGVLFWKRLSLPD